MSNNYPPARPLSYWARFSPTQIRTSDDWPTQRQHGAIRGIANSQNIDAEDACQELLGCKPDDLNRAASRTFLDWLTKQPRQRDVADKMKFCPDCKHLQSLVDGQLVCGNGHVFDVHRPLNITAQEAGASL